MAAASEEDASFAVAALRAVVGLVERVAVDLLRQAVEVLSYRAAAGDEIPFSVEEPYLWAVGAAAVADAHPWRQQQGVWQRRA